MTWHGRRIRRAIKRRMSSGAAADQPPRERSLVQRMIDLAVDKLAFFDRRRRIRRFRAGIAPMEAFAVRLSELRALPTIEPKRRLAQ